MLFFDAFDGSLLFFLLDDLHGIDSTAGSAFDEDDSSVVANSYEAEHAEVS